MMPISQSFRQRVLLSFSPLALLSTMASSRSGDKPITSYPSYRYQPRTQSFPYTAKDFLRADESSDTDFYSSPRFVYHIDDNAVSLIRSYYDQVFPRKGRILDFCSSWVSHFPQALEEIAVKTAKGELGADEAPLHVVGMGMNKAELDANPVLSNRILQDLNTDSVIPTSVGTLDAATCVVSIDYMVKPVEVLASLRERTVSGGTVHLIISNRCFPTKAVGRWLRVGEQEKLNMVGDYLWWSGWRDIEVLTLCDGQGEGGWLGLSRNDPLWVVRGKNVAGPES